MNEITILSELYNFLPYYLLDVAFSFFAGSTVVGLTSSFGFSRAAGAACFAGVTGFVGVAGFTGVATFFFVVAGTAGSTDVDVGAAGVVGACASGVTGVSTVSGVDVITSTWGAAASSLDAIVKLVK